MYDLYRRHLFFFQQYTNHFTFLYIARIRIHELKYNALDTLYLVIKVLVYIYHWIYQATLYSSYLYIYIYIIVIKVLIYFKSLK